MPFASVVFRGQVLFERDLQLFRWGLTSAFARCVAAGSPPLWTPLAGFGQPLLANPGAQVLYPWTWLGLVLSPSDAYDVYALAHVFLGGLGTFLLARRLGLSGRSSFLSGALFLLSGPFLSVVNLWQHLAGAALLPFVLVASDAALESPSRVRALLWGGAVAVQLLSGSLDFVILGALGQVVLALRHVRFGAWRGAARPLGAALLAAAFAVLVTAAQWMPALEFLGTTWRKGAPLATRLLFSVAPLAFLQTLVPLFPFDLPLAAPVRALLADNLEGRDPLLGSLYLGAAALPLVLSSLGSTKRRAALVLAALLALAGALALGRHGMAYFWAVETFPVLDLFRFPAKAMVLVALAFALLAGLGLDAWDHGPRRAWLVAVAGTVLIALGLVALGQEGATWAQPFLVPNGAGGPAADRLEAVLASVRNAGLLAAAAAMVCLARSLRVRWGPILSGIAMLLAVADLGLAHLRLVPQAPRELFEPTPAVIEAARDDGVRRLYVFDYRRRRAGRGGAPDWKPEESAAFLALPRAEQVAVLGQEYPPDGARWGVPFGFASDVAGLESPARLSLNLLVRFHQEDEAFARLLRLGGVTHLATRHLLPELTPGPFVLRASVATSHLGPVFLYRVPRPLPRAYVVDGVRVATGPAAYGLLLDAAFDPEREVVLAAGESRPPAADFSGEARVTTDVPGFLVVEARLDRPGQLVVLEGYDAGWQARVDGTPTHVTVGNAIFLTVPLEAGAHRIELRYRPRSVVLGMALSGATLAAAALGLRRRAYSS